MYFDRISNVANMTRVHLIHAFVSKKDLRVFIGDRKTYYPCRLVLGIKLMETNRLYDV